MQRQGAAGRGLVTPGRVQRPCAMEGVEVRHVDSKTRTSRGMSDCYAALFNPIFSTACPRCAGGRGAAGRRRQLRLGRHAAHQRGVPAQHAGRCVCVGMLRERLMCSLGTTDPARCVWQAGRWPTGVATATGAATAGQLPAGVHRHCPRPQAWGFARTSTCSPPTPLTWWPPAILSTACCCSTRRTAGLRSSSRTVGGAVGLRGREVEWLE